jgi:hypothetical protein
VTRGVDDLLADLAEAVDAAAELVDLGKERRDAERPLRLAGEAVIGRLGDVATKLPDDWVTLRDDVPRIGEAIRHWGQSQTRSCQIRA